MMNEPKTQKGFTLIELMVAAAIIALIATIGLSSLDVSRAKARDNKKVADMKNVQNALELYQVGAGSYPQPKDPSGNDIIAINKTDQSAQSMSDALQVIVGNKYLSVLPYPPKGTGIPGDAYYYQTANVGSDVYQCGNKTLGLGGLPYIIYFTTERPQNLTPLYKNNLPINVGAYGYCLTLN